MTEGEIVELFAESDAFGALDETALARLAARAEVHEYRRNQIVFDAGDPGDRAYVIAKGSIRTALVGPGEATLEIARVARPSLFGHLALLDRGARAARTQAVLPSTLVSLSRTEVFEIAATNPEIFEGLFRALGHLVRRSAALAADLCFMDARARLAQRLLQLGDQPEGPGDLTRSKRVSQSELARMVGVSRQTVNILLQEFQSLGHINIGPQGVSILDAPALRDIMAPSVADNAVR